MKKVKITVMKTARHRDLIEKFENPLENPCPMVEGQSFTSNGANMPKGFCESAWGSLYPFVLALSCGGRDIFGGWMKNKNAAMVSCNDGFRPVSFLVEATDEDAENE